jgi:hypothetical protein
MVELVNKVIEHKHRISSHKLEELIVNHLKEYIKDCPNDADLGAKLRKDVFTANNLLKKILPIWQKTVTID